MLPSAANVRPRADDQLLPISSSTKPGGIVKGLSLLVILTDSELRGTSLSHPASAPKRPTPSAKLNEERIRSPHQIMRAAQARFTPSVLQSHCADFPGFAGNVQSQAAKSGG
jgi:hypothetical protein